MDLIITNVVGAATYVDVCIVSPILANQYHLTQAANKPGYAALRAEYGKRQRYPVPNMIPFALELGGRPGPTAKLFIRQLFSTDGATTDQRIADAWSTISTALHSAVATQINKTGTLQAPPQQQPPPNHSLPPVAAGSS